MATLNDRGHEVLDPTPRVIPVKGLARQEPLHLRIRRMILEETAKQHEGYESFADADDFEIEDEEMASPYEKDFDKIQMPDLPKATQEVSSEPSKAPPKAEKVYSEEDVQKLIQEAQKASPAS